MTPARYDAVAEEGMGAISEDVIAKLLEVGPLLIGAMAGFVQYLANQLP